MSDKVPMTVEGNALLTAELKKLKFEDRPRIIAAIEEARSHGDLSENAEYHAAREQQAFAEGRIQELEGVLSHAQVIDPKTLSGDKILFGATVKLQNLETKEKKSYQIVGQYEANLEQGKISLISPLSKALIGKGRGDIAETVGRFLQMLFGGRHIMSDDVVFELRNVGHAVDQVVIVNRRRGGTGRGDHFRFRAEPVSGIGDRLGDRNKRVKHHIHREVPVFV